MSEQSDQILIDSTQISSLKRVLKEALEYHYSNFVKLEELAKPYFGANFKIHNTFAHAEAMINIKFEAQAYICQLRRLKHFIIFFQQKKIINEPNDSGLKQIWRDLMQDNGVINMLANKWAVHRSVDDPKDETKELHLEVLLNLDGPVTMWGNNHMYLSIDKYSFYLYDYHPRVLRFINWVFETVEKPDV